MYELVAVLLILLGVGIIVMEVLGLLKGKRAKWEHDTWGKWNLPAGYVAGAFFFVIGGLMWAVF